MKAGFIGLGTMGASMAANLQKGIQRDGHTVLVHDVRREAAAPLTSGTAPCGPTARRRWPPSATSYFLPCRVRSNSTR